MGTIISIDFQQQFDRKMVETVVRIFQPSCYDIFYYKYSAEGWQVADAEACADCSYFDIHGNRNYEPDYVAAARAVACMELVK